MTALALLALLASPVRSAETPAAAVARVMARADALIASQKGLDARDVAALDKKAQALGEELQKHGWRAAEALGAVAAYKPRHPKARLLAVSFLGLIRDPAALAPLEKLLLDPEQDPVVRALAAQSLAGQNAPDAPVRAALCAALAQKDLPRDVADEALIPAAKLGCESPEALVRLARAGGPRPAGRDLATASRALTALGRSRGPASFAALLDLVRWFPPQGDARAAAIKALDLRRAEAVAWRKPETLPVVLAALRSESGRWDTMLPLVRLSAALGTEAVPSLLRLAKHSDAEVLAEAAEALVSFGEVRALPDLEAAVAGAMTDPRFSPKEGRPDPAGLLARIEKAAAALRRLK